MSEMRSLAKDTAIYGISSTTATNSTSSRHEMTSTLSLFAPPTSRPEKSSDNRPPDMFTVDKPIVPTNPSAMAGSHLSLSAMRVTRVG
jgi:hypothetical protein